ncbi:phytanoyl-CoA dioxygenase family protein [Zavarzinia sp. CC-PAN008]|uniref:phytanoyl-CoA dioxygenase family protein n=1 Tax=Zavarzinia sp. CC-PAN008 TaxID=3243332 RepID=UPI003F7444D4
MQKHVKPPQVDYGSEQAAMERYLAEGHARAMALDNRGPLRFTPDGRIHPDILDSYGRHGFYILEGVFGPQELAEIEADVLDILERLPVGRTATVDAHGRPALGIDCAVSPFHWSKPLGDPAGGTSFADGRHPVKMFEPKPAEDAPEEAVYLMLGTLQFSEATLRAYAHPGLLAMAAAVNGDDFVPYNEAYFIKEPGLGASVAWHQDGVSGWARPDWDQGTHGFNFMGQIYGSTAANGVWVVPGTHAQGRVDIKAMVAAAGTERLPQAVPIVCAPGDVCITNRQALHGSFANTSPDWRITVNFGFNRRASVVGASVNNGPKSPSTYTDAVVDKRAEMIGLAIDARAQRFPDEVPFVYHPHAKAGRTFRWDDAARAAIRDYNLLDLRT